MISVADKKRVVGNDGRTVDRVVHLDLRASPDKKERVTSIGLICERFGRIFREFEDRDISIFVSQVNLVINDQP